MFSIEHDREEIDVRRKQLKTIFDADQNSNDLRWKIRPRVDQNRSAFSTTKRRTVSFLISSPKWWDNDLSYLPSRHIRPVDQRMIIGISKRTRQKMSRRVKKLEKNSRWQLRHLFIRFNDLVALSLDVILPYDLRTKSLYFSGRDVRTTRM